MHKNPAERARRGCSVCVPCQDAFSDAMARNFRRSITLRRTNPRTRALSPSNAHKRYAARTEDGVPSTKPSTRHLFLGLSALKDKELNSLLWHGTAKKSRP